jgi:hypothetical protein
MAMAAPQKRNKTVEKRGGKKEKSQRIMEKVSVGVGALRQIHRSSIGLLAHESRLSMHLCAPSRQTRCCCLAVMA